MPHIDYYFSMLSPYTYLAGTRLEQIVQRTGASLTYKPFDLMAAFPRTGGVPVGQRHPSRIDYRAQVLPRTARKLGMELNMKPAFWPVNAAPASYAVIAAQAAGGGDLGGLVHRLLRDCWVADQDISDDAVIGAALKSHGFDPALTLTGMLAGAEEYAANLESAVSAGVFGSPFYVVDSGQKFWGQDSLDDLDLHLQGKL